MVTFWNARVKIAQRKINYLRNWWTAHLGKYTLERTRNGLHSQEVSRGFKRETTTSEISEYIEFKYVLCHLKNHLDLGGELKLDFSNEKINFSNKVMHRLWLDDCDNQIKLERLKQITHSVCR